MTEIELELPDLRRISVTEEGVCFDGKILLNQRELRHLGAKRKVLIEFFSALEACGKKIFSSDENNAN